MSKMFLEKVRSEALAHLSYIVGHQGQAAVIDPRRDCEVYVEIARRYDATITHVFETHRNEDYVIGSRELARRTGATIHHGAAMDWAYGEDVSEGDEFMLGGIRLRVLETPGHTYESISLALIDTQVSDDPVAVFTGDALFIGDVGRTDFFPERAEEVAGLLYDSIHEKLLPLGDQTILCPAHGAGSVCGSGMADREFSTLGYERKHSPPLQKDRDEFIRYKVNEQHEMPPYFKKMEVYNQQGTAPLMPVLPAPAPMDVKTFAQAMAKAIVVDVRSPEAVAGAMIPDSLVIPLNMIPSFAGWFLDYDQPILLVVEDTADVETAVRHLTRIGYDDVIGYLTGGLHEWETDGRVFDRVPAVSINQLKQRISSDEDFTLLDVRKDQEWQSGRIRGAKHIFIGELPQRLAEIPKARPVTTFCGSGRRAMIAASILKRNGFEQVEDHLGSMAAWQAAGGDVENGGGRS